MESPSTRRKTSKSISALIFLIFIGIGFLLFSFVAMTCGFIINYHEDFEASSGGQMLESKIQSEFDYSQYWLGLPFLVTAFLSIASATFQTRRSLTMTTLIFFFICIALALFAIVLEGVDWVYWKNLNRVERHWENKDGYQCSDSGATCVCSNSNNNKTITISNTTSCSNIATLSGLYGGIVAPAIMGIFLSLAGIVVILKSFSWKQQSRRRYMEYDLQKVNPVEYYNSSYPKKAYQNGIAMKELPTLAGGNSFGKPMYG